MTCFDPLAPRLTLDRSGDLTAHSVPIFCFGRWTDMPSLGLLHLVVQQHSQHSYSDPFSLFKHCSSGHLFDGTRGPSEAWPLVRCLDCIGKMLTRNVSTNCHRGILHLRLHIRFPGFLSCPMLLTWNSRHHTRLCRTDAV